MSSWEEIANEVAPVSAPVRGLATGANRRPVTNSPDSSEITAHFLTPPTAPLIVPVPDYPRDAPLENTLRGQEISLAGHGAYYAMHHDAEIYAPSYQNLANRLEQVLAGGNIHRLRGAQLSDLLFMDIETTGLSSSGPLFLIGTLRFERDEKRDWGGQLEWFLAREPDEERAALAAYHRVARGQHLLTFNGLKFDWPYIEGRSQRWGLTFQAPSEHFDTYYLFRKLWRDRIPNGRLQTMETFVCGRARHDDIASNRIPQTYAQWLQLRSAGRGAHLLAPIVASQCFGRADDGRIACVTRAKNALFTICQSRLILCTLSRKYLPRTICTLRRTRARVLQLNVGKKCNQTCAHCHVNAGPARTEMMTHVTPPNSILALATNHSRFKPSILPAAHRN